MSEELKPNPLHHHDRHPWAQPGDEPNRAWMMRFADPDMRAMVWTDEDAERDAREAYAKYSPAWNVYLFATVEVRANPPQGDVSGLVAVLEVFAEKDRHRIISGSPGPLYTAGWNGAAAHFADLATQALAALTTKETDHGQD